MSLYQQDLAYIQAAAFGALARGAAPEVVRRLRHASIPIRRVVDVGCGAGPLTEALVAEGFETTGIDSSAELLSIAQATAPNARFINASIHDVAIPPCEAIVALGEPLTYHPEGSNAHSRISGFFQSASSVLPTGGILIFDIIETGEPSLSRRIWSSGDDWAVLVDVTEDAASQTLIRNIETFRRVGEFYRRGREVHRVQLFDTQWLCDELASRGFEVETSQEYGTQPLAPRRRAFFATRFRSASSQ
jgi:SAM-dependent methyltransferase